MPKIDHDTKEKILKAAEIVFHQNGFKGTRTTRIAEQAGISRTMLHYYFSTKEALFHEVLKNTLGTVVTHLRQLVVSSQNLHEVITTLVNVISDLLDAKPHLPSFIVNIMNETPELPLMLASMEQDDLPAQLNALLRREQEKGTVGMHVTGEDLMMHIYGICALPYLTAPYIAAKEHRDAEAMQTLYNERRAKNVAFIMAGIRPIIA